jgi:hypothetical protein
VRLDSSNGSVSSGVLRCGLFRWALRRRRGFEQASSRLRAGALGSCVQALPVAVGGVLGGLGLQLRRRRYLLGEALVSPNPAPGAPWLPRYPRIPLLDPLHLHPFCTPSAPLLHPFCTPSAPLLHPFCTSSAPLLHPFCTPSAPLLLPDRQSRRKADSAQSERRLSADATQTQRRPNADHNADESQGVQSPRPPSRGPLPAPSELRCDRFAGVESALRWR